MRTYLVRYRERGNKDGTVYETSVTASSAKEAKKLAIYLCGASVMLL